MSARDRRLHERQMSYDARHGHQILHVRATAAPQQYSSHSAAPGSAAPPANPVVSDQLLRLRKSMGTKQKPSHELLRSSENNEFNDSQSSGNGTERPDYDRITSGAECPPDPTGVRQHYPYTSSGGSSSGTDLVHRGYAASLGIQRRPAQHYDGSATPALLTARSRRGDGRTEPEIEVAGLPSHRTGRSYKWPGDPAEDELHEPHPSNERPNTASTLRSPYAWYSE